MSPVVSLGNWQWINWSNIPGLLDWIAFILGGVGIFVALRQLFKSTGALRAAEKALKETRSTLIKNQLVAILPGITEISTSIDATLQSDNPDEAQKALGRFSDFAQESAVLLVATTRDFEEIAQALVSASAEASAARGQLFRREDQSVVELIGPVAATIRNLGPRVRGASMSLRNDPGSNTHVG